VEWNAADKAPNPKLQTPQATTAIKGSDGDGSGRRANKGAAPGGGKGPRLRQWIARSNGVWGLKFEASLEFGIWILKIPVLLLAEKIEELQCPGYQN